MQSYSPVLTRRLTHDRAITALIEATRYPAAGRLRIAGLAPGRHYRLRGAAHGFARTDADGAVTVELTLAGPALLLLVPVI